MKKEVLFWGRVSDPATIIKNRLPFNSHHSFVEAIFVDKTEKDKICENFLQKCKTANLKILVDVEMTNYQNLQENMSAHMYIETEKSRLHVSEMPRDFSRGVIFIRFDG
ncbi:hypothetical protein MHBO_002471 [Bonamia ostreae]|uniref:Uncharacterized protein n=1 Tax=Bonamia ostreae TaxID=126728 RepID=A0ABV2AMG5_9EUKA